MKAEEKDGLVPGMPREESFKVSNVASRMRIVR